MLVAAAQLSPVYLDRDATVDRAIAAIHEASARGAQLIVFTYRAARRVDLLGELHAPRATRDVLLGSRGARHANLGSRGAVAVQLDVIDKPSSTFVAIPDLD